MTVVPKSEPATVKANIAAMGGPHLSPMTLRFGAQAAAPLRNGGLSAIQPRSAARRSRRRAPTRPITAFRSQCTNRFRPATSRSRRSPARPTRRAESPCGTTYDDYYVVRANALEDNVRFYRVAKGRREQLAGADIKVAANLWHTLALKAEGDRFSISYDGKTLFTAEDQTFAGPGKVALWTKADSVTHFDMIAITPLD